MPEPPPDAKAGEPTLAERIANANPSTLFGNWNYTIPIPPDRMPTVENILAAVAKGQRLQAEIGFCNLLRLAGYDPDSPEFKDTPARAVKAFLEMAGRHGPVPDQKAIDDLLTVFPDQQYDEMVVCRNIRFASVCAHHLLPFFGTAAVGYLPNCHSRKVVGLSKLARLVDLFAPRLQTQERLTAQIADGLMSSHLCPAGVGVRLTAVHTCMSCRGADQPDAETVTTALLGAFREDTDVRLEFLGTIGGGK